MLKLGLTGSIATGKSTILAAFAALGVPVFSADEAVHELYESAAVEPVGRAFADVVRDGRIDRQALSAQLVRAPRRLVELEAIVHPLVRARLAGFFAAAGRAGAPLAVADIPLLFESGHDYGLDRIAVTFVDEETQRRRALSRPGMSVEKLSAILARQLPQAEKCRRADYLFDTGRPLGENVAAVERLVRELGGAGEAG